MKNASSFLVRAKGLTDKQEQLDVNDNGKIDHEDLANLRKGAKPDPVGESSVKAVAVDAKQLDHFKYYFLAKLRSFVESIEGDLGSAKPDDKHMKLFLDHAHNDLVNIQTMAKGALEHLKKISS